MKRIFSLLVLAIAITTSAFAQIKICEVFSQKSAGGRGGTYMNYTIRFENKKYALSEVDSIISIADGASLKYYFQRNDKGPHEMGFSQALVAAKCAICPDVTAKPANITKGVVIYYKMEGNKTPAKKKIKKFKQLPDMLNLSGI